MPKRDRRAFGKTVPKHPPQLDLFADTPRFHVPILIDRAPILAEWRNRCARVVEDLSGALADTRAFQDQALPAYRAWVAREFGAELSALRELSENLARSEAIHRATEAEALIRGKGVAAAYAAVMARKNAGEDLFPPDFHSFSDDDWDDGWEAVDPHTDYRSESGRTPHEPDFRRDAPAPSETPDVPPENSPEDSRVRRLYRKLAFALHPDANPNPSPRDQALWAEVQSAYQARDVSRLEIALAGIEANGKIDFSGVDQIATLQALFADRSRELRAATAEFRRLKKDPAWTYWTLAGTTGDFNLLREGIERDLLAEFLRLRRRIDHLQGLFEKWATGRRKRASTV